MQPPRSEKPIKKEHSPLEDAPFPIKTYKFRLCFFSYNFKRDFYRNLLVKFYDSLV